MENINKQKILQAIGKVYEQAKRCKLEKSFFDSVDAELSMLSKYFQTSKEQTFFIAMVFALNYKGDTVDMNDLIDYFDCNPMKILEYSDDFVHLSNVGIFAKQKSNHRVKMAGANDQFTIHEKISEAILNDLPIPEITVQKIDGIVGLLNKLYEFGLMRKNGLISTKDLFQSASLFISEQEHLPLIERLSLFNFEIQDTYLYLFLIWKTISGKETIDISVTLEGMYDDPSKRMEDMQKLLSGEHSLVKNKLVEVEEAQFFNDTELKLTDTSHQLLNECGIKLFLSKKKKDNVIVPSEIVGRELIFDPIEMNQLELLKKLLQDEKLKETQSRLTDKGLPTGIAILLHGAPGTGKTEIVKQLAKETEREIVKVEISQSKSMWFGESEKIIKRIFTEYKSYAKDCERMPILFFNEADAIISKRKEIGSSNVGQTENAIQNILLEELENFEGILFATTNLASNLDKAFERRFLFKIEFQKPSATIRAKIWKSKLAYLEEYECESLAANFDFSGGQIENIVRKNEIEEIVYGTSSNFENILSFCRAESIVSDKVHIGFLKS